MWYDVTLRTHIAWLRRGVWVTNARTALERRDCWKGKSVAQHDWLWKGSAPTVALLVKKVVAACRIAGFPKHYCLTNRSTSTLWLSDAVLLKKNRFPRSSRLGSWKPKMYQLSIRNICFAEGYLVVIVNHSLQTLNTFCLACYSKWAVKWRKKHLSRTKPIWYVGIIYSRYCFRNYHNF